MMAAAIGLAVGWFLGNMHGRMQGAKELLQTYKHLLEYGRPSKPIATVKDAPATVEGMAEVRIGETARVNLTDHLAQGAGVSPERARVEADKLIAQYESGGQIQST